MEPILCPCCGRKPIVSHILTKKFGSTVLMKGYMTGDYRVYQVRCCCGNHGREDINRSTAIYYWNNQTI